MSTQTTDAVAVPGNGNQWGIVPLADASPKFEDDASQIQPSALPKLAAVLDETFGQAALWASSARGLVSSTAELARLSYEARTFCHLQTGAIDWAARTTAYSSLYADRLRRYCMGQQLEDGSGGLGMTEKEYKKLASAISSWVNDNDYRNLFIAQYGASHDPEVKKVADKVAPKLALPKVAADYVQAQITAQKSKGGTGGKLIGWDPADAPKANQKVGLTRQERRNAETQQNETGDNASSRTPSALWEKVRNETAKTVDGKPFLSYLHCVNETYRLQSTLAVKLIGQGEDKRPTVKDKPKCVALLREMATMATMLADALSPDTAEQVKREDVEKHYWKNQD